MKVGIVFEGGAYRTIFACGVIDALLENHIYTDYMIGVSAGAGYGVSYATRQYKRNLKIIMRYCDDKRYLSFKNWFKKDNRSIFGLDFVYNKVPNELILFDYDAYLKNGVDFICVGTNTDTGKAEYFPFDPNDKNMVALQATCALPLLFPKITLNGKHYWDGGITDPIPFKKAFLDGCDKVIVVSTREKYYRKKDNNRLKHLLPLFHKNTELVKALSNFRNNYNETVEELEQYEAKEKVFVFRPKTTKGFDMMERDRKKLLTMYNDGYKQTIRRLDDLKEYLSSN